MAQFTVNTHRREPYSAFNFQVVLDGQVVAGVSKVSPLKRTTEVIKHREGNDVSHARLSPGQTAHDAITLERGVTYDPVFNDWANQVYSPEGLGGVSLLRFRKDILINLMNLQGVVVRSYKVFQCWPSEYIALPELDANGNGIAIQTLVLQNHGWELETALLEVLET